MPALVESAEQRKDEPSNFSNGIFAKKRTHFVPCRFGIQTSLIGDLLLFTTQVDSFVEKLILHNLVIYLICLSRQYVTSIQSNNVIG